MPFNRLIEEQLDLLEEENPVVKKRISINDRCEENMGQMSIKEWRNDLSMLLKTDLDRVIYSGDFDELVVDGQRTYINLADQEEGIQLVEISYVNDVENMRMLTLITKNVNLFFSSYQKVQLTFSPIESGEPHLRKYTVKGYEKIIFRDTLRFSIEGKVAYH